MSAPANQITSPVFVEQDKVVVYLKKTDYPYVFVYVCPQGHDCTTNVYMAEPIMVLNGSLLTLWFKHSSSWVWRSLEGTITKNRTSLTQRLLSSGRAKQAKAS